jgi:proteasome lid subunit RPN8/RPN11
LPIREVVIYRKVLDHFKRRALRKYPREYGRMLWGTVEGETVYVCMTAPAQVCDGDEDSLELVADEAYGEPVDDGEVILLGSIHTHPDAYCEPSDEDVQDAKDEGEIVFGICGIQKSETGRPRRYTSFAFFEGATGKPIELTVAE